MSKKVVDLLVGEFERRKKRNSRYSLRAYARSLGISSGRVSEFMSGKRKLTSKMSERLIEHLVPAAEKRRKLMNELGLLSRHSSETMLREDQLSLIVDWYYAALLSLLEAEKLRADSVWLSKRLGITPAQVQEALSRLQRLGLIKIEHEKGREVWTTTMKNTATSQDIPSWALRESHRQMMEKAVQSLEEVAVELRDISSITMAIDVKKLSLAKKEIHNFRRRLATLLETGEKSEVYGLNIQLFPLTKV